VQVNEFSMFMGPAIWKKQVGETLYSIRCIPIGGYCAMEGEDSDTDNPRSFQKAAWWKRLIILVAGAFMNFVIGILLIAIVLTPVKAMAVLRVEAIEPWSTLDDYGLQVGDQIIEIDGEKMYQYNDFSMMLSLNPGEVHDLVVMRDGKEIPKIHPAQKSVKVLKKLIETFTDEGDVVIDPCCGSGATLRAARELNRSAFGFEIDRTFYQRAKDEMLVFPTEQQMDIYDYAAKGISI
jgi:membrane-associated protease RseP (regulator of RpoE activity)